MSRACRVCTARLPRVLSFDRLCMRCFDAFCAWVEAQPMGSPAFRWAYDSDAWIAPPEVVDEWLRHRENTGPL